MKAILITIGDEILMGQILDTNSRFMARRLTSIGVEVMEQLSVSDSREEIYRSVDYAMHKADLVMVTGGLGPTKDDVTKKVLAEYFNTRVVYNAQAMAWLEELLKNRSLPLNEKNRTQAWLPEDCRILRNFKGTASGMWFERDGRILVSMPGVPFEMEHLVDTCLIPELRSRFPHLLLEYRMMRVYDITESALADRLETWEDGLGEGLGLAYLPSPGMIRLRLTAKGEAVKGLDGVYAGLKRELEGLRFTEGEDSIEVQLGRKLRDRGLTVATAESCTGGEIARMITSVPGSSDYYKGSVISYANEVKTGVLGVDAQAIARDGVVSEAVVLQMAEGARRLMHTDYAVSTSGVAGPGGGTEECPVGTVWVGLAGPRGSYARKYLLSFTRERNMAKAASKAVEMLLLDLDGKGGGGR